MKVKPVIFSHHDDYFKGLAALFSLIQAPGDTQTAIGSAILVKNGITLLNGSYGTGKTQLVNLVKRIFFRHGQGEGYDFDYETCHQDLTAFDVLYHLDLAALQQGREEVHAKKIVSARFKFLNEIQRANPSLYNALLPLLSERRVTFRDMEFTSPDYILVMDQNPQDAASSEIPRAFFDRIDFMINMAAIDMRQSRILLERRTTTEGIEWGSLEEFTNHVLSSEQMAAIWEDVRRVAVAEREALLGSFLVNSFGVCVNADRSLAAEEFHLDCENCKYKGEVCRGVKTVPGQRALNSLFKLSQARAWMSRRGAVAFDDLVFSLPYVLAHRLELRHDEQAVYENSFHWLRKKALTEVLVNKFDSWRKVLDEADKGEWDEAEKVAREDLVVARFLETRRI